MSVDIVITVRGGPAAKSRCEGRFDGAALATAMLRDMVEAAQACPEVGRVHVVTPTPEIVEGLDVILIVEDAPAGINAAFERARRTVPPETMLILMPGDLPQIRAEDLSALIAAHEPGTITIVPSATDGGTGAIMMRADAAMDFAFGTGSFARHMANPAARRFDSAALGDDLDRPEDAIRAMARAGRHSRACLARQIQDAA
jgi:2-phospho-L-lactate guanylyltransferase